MPSYNCSSKTEWKTLLQPRIKTRLCAARVPAAEVARRPNMRARTFNPQPVLSLSAFTLELVISPISVTSRRHPVVTDAAAALNPDWRVGVSEEAAAR